MSNTTYGAIKLATAEDVGAVLKKKTGTVNGYKPKEWADTINLMGLLPIRTASGAVASFSDGADDVPLKSLTAQIVPIQEGTGDPSPTNKRPISGTSVLDIYHSGADTSNPTIYTIALGRTVYGGSSEVVGGSGMSDLKYLEIDGTEASLTLDSASNVVRLTLSDLPSSNVTSQDYRYWGSESNYKYVATSNLNNNEVTMRTSGYLYYKNTSCTTLSDFQTFFANQKSNGTPFAVCYELATPIDFTFTGQEINSLLGVNNIWHDGNGTTEVEYRADIDLLITELGG